MADKQTNEILSHQPNLPECGVLVESHHHCPNFKTATHLHSYSTLIYVVSGAGRCITRSAEYRLQSDSVLMLERNMPHQMIDKPGSAMVVFVVYFQEKLPMLNDELLRRVFKTPMVQVPRHNSRQMRQILRQMLFEQKTKPEFYETALLQCFSSILLMIYRLSAAGGEIISSGKKSTQRVQNALKYVKTHYYETFTLSDIAEDAGLSTRQFANICRRLTQKSFIQYLNSIRAEKAKQLLVNTSMSISAIAFEVGFEEVSTFYRAFSKHQGISPASLRKNNLEMI